MDHDRIHAREPSHHVDRWTPGRIQEIIERHGHCIVTVMPTSDEREPLELTVTIAVRDLFVSRLDLGSDESPVGTQIWYRQRGE